MLNPKDKKKFDKIKARFIDCCRCHPEQVKKNEVIRFGARVFEEGLWLARMIDQLLGIKPTPVPEDMGEGTDDEPVPEEEAVA